MIIEDLLRMREDLVEEIGLYKLNIITDNVMKRFLENNKRQEDMLMILMLLSRILYNIYDCMYNGVVRNIKEVWTFLGRCNQYCTIYRETLPSLICDIKNVVLNKYYEIDDLEQDILLIAIEEILKYVVRNATHKKYKGVLGMAKTTLPRTLAGKLIMDYENDNFITDSFNIQLSAQSFLTHYTHTIDQLCDFYSKIGRTKDGYLEFIYKHTHKKKKEEIVYE